MATLKDIWNNIELIDKHEVIENLLQPLDFDEPLWIVEARLRTQMKSSTRDVAAFISQALISIMKISRTMVVDIDSSRCIPPEAFDILISDIKDSDIILLGKELDHANLSESVADGDFPVTGTFYGDNLRVFVALTVRKKNKCVWVLFLLDTGSPHTFLKPDTYDLLGFGGSIPNVTQVDINGISLAVSPSHGHFYNINLLGQNFMKAAQIDLNLDYAKGRVVLKRGLYGV